jgi:hypothetical protein
VGYFEEAWTEALRAPDSMRLQLTSIMRNRFLAAVLAALAFLVPEAFAKDRTKSPQSAPRAKKIKPYKAPKIKPYKAKKIDRKSNRIR